MANEKKIIEKSNQKSSKGDDSDDSIEILDDFLKD